MGFEFFIAIDGFPVALLACQVSIFCTANWPCIQSIAHNEAMGTMNVRVSLDYSDLPIMTSQRKN